MKIIFDIGHPAHVHYFSNLIQNLYELGHSVFISARNKEIINHLLSNKGFVYYSRGKGSDNFFGKLFYLVTANIQLYQWSKKINPDLFIGFASPYAAHIAYILKKPSIIIDDTEHSFLNHILYKSFSSVILNPICFAKDMGKNQIFFNSYIELCYLHPNYFSPIKSIKKELCIPESQGFAIIRFISWDAIHDICKKGLSINEKIKIVETLSKHLTVFISSESKLPEKLQKYAYPLPVTTMHDSLAACELFVGEGATMASECAMLGVPAIYINSIKCATILEQSANYGLIYDYRTFDGVLEKALSIINSSQKKEIHLNNRKKLLSEKIDLTAFLTWFIQEYPKSHEILKLNPDIQYKYLKASSFPNLC